MGWWGHDIMAGDLPLECYNDILKWANISTEYFDMKLSKLDKKKLKVNIKNIIFKIKSYEDDEEYQLYVKILSLQVLALLLMNNSITISIHLYNLILKYNKILQNSEHCDSFKFPNVRRRVLNKFEKDIKYYKDKKIHQIKA